MPSMPMADTLQIKTVHVTGFDKRYDSENNKYYIYRIDVERKDGRTQVVFRRFR